MIAVAVGDGEDGHRHIGYLLDLGEHLLGRFLAHLGVDDHDLFLADDDGTIGPASALHLVNTLGDFF